jgi:hypothetical protein
VRLDVLRRRRPPQEPEEIEHSDQAAVPVHAELASRQQRLGGELPLHERQPVGTGQPEAESRVFGRPLAHRAGRVVRGDGDVPDAPVRARDVVLHNDRPVLAVVLPLGCPREVDGGERLEGVADAAHRRGEAQGGSACFVPHAGHLTRLPLVSSVTVIGCLQCQQLTAAGE